jgi:hypothetical protein
MNHIISIALMVFISSACTYSQQIFEPQNSRFDKGALIYNKNLHSLANSHNSILNYSEYMLSLFQDEKTDNSKTPKIRNITIELLTGSLSTFLVGAFFYDNIGKNVEEDIIGLMANSAVAIASTLVATSAIVYYIGYLLEDNGSFKKTLWGSLIGGAITSTLSQLVDENNRDLRLGVIAVGIPIGAVTGFNLSLK